MKVFEKKPLERLRFVIQTGGNNPKVKLNFTGFEGVAFAAIMFDKTYQITPKGMCLVFGENDEYRGYIKIVDGLPKKFLPEPQDAGTYFKDWYMVAE